MSHQEEPPPGSWEMVPSTGPRNGMTTYAVSGSGLSGTFTIEHHPSTDPAHLLLTSGRFLEREASSLADYDLLSIRGTHFMCSHVINQHEDFPRIPLAGLDAVFNPTPLSFETHAHAEAVIYTIFHHWRRERVPQLSIPRHTAPRSLPTPSTTPGRPPAVQPSRGGDVPKHIPPGPPPLPVVEAIRQAQAKAQHKTATNLPHPPPPKRDHPR